MAISRTSRLRRTATLPIIVFVVCGLVVPAATATHANHVLSATRWQSIGLSVSGLSVHSLAVGTKKPNTVFAGTESGIYRFQGGHSWKRVLKSDSVGDVYLLPNDRTVLGCDNSGYVDVSTDGGTHWRQHLVTPLGVFSVSVQPGNPRHILAGAAGGIYLSQDGGLRWQRRYDIKQGAVDTMAWAPGSSMVVFAGSAVAGSALHSAGVLYSQDAGLTWRPFGHHLNDGGAIMSLTVTPDHVYVGTMGNAVWRASMSITTWRKVAAGMPAVNDHGAALATIPAHPGTLYVGTIGFGVFRTTDYGAHWNNLSAGLSVANNATVVRSMAYAVPQRTLYAGTDDGVYVLAPV